jgi:hypothetical protein
MPQVEAPGVNSVARRMSGAHAPRSAIPHMSRPGCEPARCVHRAASGSPRHATSRQSAPDVEHVAYATASRPPLSAGPHPTALQVHAATAHTDRRRMCSCRTQKLPRTDPPMQCIGLKLTGASSAPAPYAVLCSTCTACKSSAVPLAPHTTHLARAVVFPTCPFGCAVRTTRACAERHAQSHAQLAAFTSHWGR